MAEYLNEDIYQQNVKKLKTIGKVLLIVGIIGLILGLILILVGFFSFGNVGINSVSSDTIDVTKTAQGALGSMGIFVLGGLLDSFGFLVTIAGVIVTIIAHRREIAAFSTQQVMPVAQEGIDKMAPTIGNAAGEIAKGIKKGLNEADKEQ